MPEDAGFAYSVTEPISGVNGWSLDPCPRRMHPPNADPTSSPAHTPPSDSSLVSRPLPQPHRFHHNHSSFTAAFDVVIIGVHLTVSGGSKARKSAWYLVRFIIVFFCWCNVQPTCVTRHVFSFHAYRVYCCLCICSSDLFIVHTNDDDHNTPFYIYPPPEPLSAIHFLCQ
jgi:hypothetical protein